MKYYPVILCYTSLKTTDHYEIFRGIEGKSPFIQAQERLNEILPVKDWVIAKIKNKLEIQIVKEKNI
mgnify:CR=1 FL=1